MLHLMSVAALPVFIASLGVLALRQSLVTAMPVVVACQALGLALLVWARTTFPKGSFRVTAKPAGSLVLRTGPYRFIRHPMYAGAMFILWASIAGHPSAVHAGIGLFATGVVLGKIVAEERLLKASCPGYAEYARVTKALIPFVL